MLLTQDSTGTAGGCVTRFARGPVCPQARSPVGPWARSPVRPLARLPVRQYSRFRRWAGLPVRQFSQLTGGKSHLFRIAERHLSLLSFTFQL